MKPQVIMSKHNGNLAVAIPVYILLSSEELDVYTDYKIIMVNYNKPIGYMLDANSKTSEFCNKEVIDKNCEWLGDL